MKCTNCGAELASEDNFCGECGAPRPQWSPEQSRRAQDKLVEGVPPRFAEAEQRFAALRARYQAGELDDSAYEAGLQKMVIEDGAGGYWMLGADSGEWYWYDGQQWMRRDPPLAAVAVERPQVWPAPPPDVAPPMPAAPPTRRGLPWNWIAVGCGGLLVIAVVVAGVLAVPRLLPLFSTPVKPTAVVAAPTATLQQAQDTAQTAMLLPTATPTLEPTATPPPTATPTVELAATPLPTAMPTATPPVEPTATPTPAPLPPTDIPTPVPPTKMPLPLNKIAFVTNRDGNNEIYIMNADGSEVTRLTNNPADDRYPSWSPDGRRIAFASDRDGNMEIYVMNADGSGQTRLTNTPAHDGDPTWSPDGTRIAFASTQDVRSDIWVMNADGSNQVKLREFGVSPAWSPDGSQIAAPFQFGSFMHLGVMPADGSAEPQPLLQLHINNWPAWSPDGSRIALESAESPDNSEILIINADGTNLVNLTKTLAIVELHPTWSPEGTRIAFASDRDGNAEIYVMNADGSGVKRLTNNPAWEGHPSWSP